MSIVNIYAVRRKTTLVARIMVASLVLGLVASWQELPVLYFTCFTVNIMSWLWLYRSFRMEKLIEQYQKILLVRPEMEWKNFFLYRKIMDCKNLRKPVPEAVVIHHMNLLSVLGMREGIPPLYKKRTKLFYEDLTNEGDKHCGSLQ